MHAPTAPSPSGLPTTRRRARAGVWLLALAIALQGSVIAMASAAGPAHVHVAPTAEAQHDPMLDGVRMVQNHHGSGAHPHPHPHPHSHRHAHAHIERHAHDSDDADVIYLDDGHDDAGGVKLKDASGKRMAGELDTPPIALAPATAAPAVGAGAVDPACDYGSHVSARLERPPR
jgi:hypothetical protein